MQTLTTLVMVFVIAATPAVATGQKEVTTTDRTAALKAMASDIPLGTRVRLQIREGRRLTATLMQVTAEGIVVQRVSRIPEPPVTVRFDELARFERQEKTGFSVAKALGIGLAAGVGAILTLFAIVATIDD